MWNMVVSRSRLSALALFLAVPGCTALSDCKYEVGQKIRTAQAWHEFDGCNEECFTCDYRSGWKAGYYDVLTGGTGCPPVIAPKKYWKPPVFFEHDPSRRNDWYCGFQDGASCAKCQPDFHYLQTFMPGPVCCHSVSHSHVPAEPSHLADPSHVDVTTRGAEAGDASAAEPVTSTQNGSNTIPLPAASEGHPTESAYDRNPEPVAPDAVPNAAPDPSTQRRVPASVISQEKLAESDAAGDSSDVSLIEQLVMNAHLDGSR